MAMVSNSCSLRTGGLFFCGSRRRTVLLALFLFAVVGFLIKSLGWHKHTYDQSYLKSFREAALKLNTGRLKEEYEDTLRKQHPAPSYRKSAWFTDNGPPVGSLFANNSVIIERKSRDRKLVIQWTAFFGKQNWLPDVLCEGEKLTCVVSRDKRDYPKSDAILVHHGDIEELPVSRLPHQRWVFHSLEPPWLSRVVFADYNGVFNWTSTYRWDSDFPALYYNTTKRKRPKTERAFRKIFSDIMSKKKHVVAIMHSSCFPNNDRYSIVNKLRRFVRVDFFGHCGELTCWRRTDKCKETMSSYKFYLSFENDNCRNYITEKVHNPLYEWNAVPIVYGASNDEYARIMPPDSYIHVEGFSSVRKLAEYITLLDNNTKLYEKYHAWRKTHTHFEPEHFCDMCKALHNESMPVKSYRDFAGWNEQDTCSVPWISTIEIRVKQLFYRLLGIFW